MTEATLERISTAYKVSTEVFSGPLDLLLFLIKKEEVDIYDIPIARITKQYLQYVEMIQNLNLELAGEFILMAATLIRIKTRLLLPHDEEDSDEPDPREELILALVEYRKYKEAGEVLRERAIREERNYVPPAPVEKIKGRVDHEPVTSLFDLIMAFRDVVAARREESFHNVNSRLVTIEERTKHVIAFLQDKEFASFAQIFADLKTRRAAVVTFIALLELVRSHRVRLLQTSPFTELRVYRGSDYTAPKRNIDLVTARQTEDVN